MFSNEAAAAHLDRLLVLYHHGDALAHARAVDPRPSVQVVSPPLD